VKTVSVDSLGVVLPRARCWMPEAAFVIPAEDIFHSAVTRDPFPDPEHRSFTFHFKSGHAREEQLRRMGEVLRFPVPDLGAPETRRTLLPAPALGHDRVVAALDRLLAGRRLALTGNYFQGLAIEDCVQRSFEECARVAAEPAP
jgi:UDP-galactopyranose mutase